ncbi:MAG: hypothetical protein M1828_006579 [Chrysothrix sp. TS-e1954]|nr:MAG: hypothetical protein M1828_006579 [Chrysothrix sp. TS-e1954]
MSSPVPPSPQAPSSYLRRLQKRFAKNQEHKRETDLYQRDLIISSQVSKHESRLLTQRWLHLHQEKEELQKVPDDDERRVGIAAFEMDLRRYEFDEARHYRKLDEIVIAGEVLREELDIVLKKAEKIKSDYDKIVEYHTRLQGQDVLRRSDDSGDFYIDLNEYTD